MTNWARFRSFTLLILLATSNFGQTLTYMPLQRPGQASVAIDHDRKTAFIVDLGADRKGSQLLYEGKPLLDRLEEMQIKELVFSCSHPHADHMGGIEALFRNRSSFLRGSQLNEPRFSKVTVIDDAVLKSPLFALLSATLGPKPQIEIAHLSAGGKNAFAGLTSPKSTVFVENIPYTPVAAVGPHGRSIVTRITLDGKQTVVDFDDADSAVIKQVAEKLKQRSVQIDAFVVPHHGSAYHDIEPILALGPKTAIITVNPENRYGHPAPQILAELIRKLGADNVLFTGSVGKVEFGPDGIRDATYRASKRDAYALFVAKNERRAREKGNFKDAAIYEEIRSVMMGNPGDPPSAPAIVVRTPEGPDGGSGAALALVAERMDRTGSTLSPEFEINYLTVKGSDLTTLGTHRVFKPKRVSESAPRVVLSEDAAEDIARASAQRMDRLALGGFDMPTKVDEIVETRAGFADGLDAGREWAASISSRVGSAATAQAPLAKRTVPMGGMVFLEGGQLFPIGSAGDLTGATLDLCGGRLCLQPQGAESRQQAYVLPFATDELFSEVWRKVYVERVKAFYLSINPTRRFLSDLNQHMAQIPTDRLRFGTGKETSTRNEVVTAGGVSHSIIGEVLWKADVAFKSASLGFDVFTGIRIPPRSSSLTSQDAGDERDFRTDYRERWCRLYWTSGSQQISADPLLRRVTFKGNAVEARSEAMQLVNGKLQDYPAGTWCSEPKRIAAALQKEANAGTSTFAELNQLRRLAEMQSFARWAVDNAIRTTPEFRAALKPSRALDVPSWTSGVRSTTETVVQVERRMAAHPWVLRLHYGTSEITAVKPCIDQYYGDRAIDAALEAMGVKYENGTWRYGEEHKPKFVSWMNTVAASIARCAKGRALPPSSDAAEEDTDVMGSRGTMGSPVAHPEPVHIHGGVLLGDFSEQRRAQLGAKDALVLPSGRLVMRRHGKELHFWNVLNSGDPGTEFAQHVVITAGDVTESEAINGRLRLIVNAVAGSAIREELRVRSTVNLRDGLEWTSARTDSGELIANKAVWPCGEVPQKVCVADANLADLPQILGVSGAEPPIRLESLGQSMWVLDFDLSTVKQELDADADRIEANAESRLALANEYVRWGFIDTARGLQDTALESLRGDTEDYILSREVTGSDVMEARAKRIGLAQTLLRLIARPGLGRADSEYWALLLKLERELKVLPPSRSAKLWDTQKELLAAMERAFPDSAPPKTLESKRTYYAAQALRTGAVARGPANPWSRTTNER